VNTTLFLTIGAIGSVAAGVRDLFRTGARDVLRCVGAFELGLVLGAAAEAYVPGGLVLGALGGFIGGYWGFDRLIGRRVDRLEATVAEAPDSASALLAVHDRVDLVTRPIGGVRPTARYLSMLFILLLGIVLNGVGIAYDLWIANAMGSGIMFWPLAVGTRWLAEHEEGRALRRLLDARVHDGAGSVLPGGRGTGSSESGAAPEPSRLFVYGTLMSEGGGPAHRLLSGRATYLGRARVAGRLHDLGAYPGAVPVEIEVEASSEGSVPAVRGELYHLRDPGALLAALDDHEGCGPDDPVPSEFYRAVTTARTEDGSEVSAWIYWYGWPPSAGGRIPSGDWTDRTGGASPHGRPST